MALERVQELPVPCVPQLDMVIERGARDEEAVGRERDVVDLLLVAEEAGEGFRARRGRPEIHREVVAGGDEAFDNLAIDGSGFFEALFCFGDFGGGGCGDGARVVVVGGAEDEVGAEGEVVHPVRVRGQVVGQGAGGGVPDFDGFVARGGVDKSCAAPANAGDGVFVAGQSEVDALGDRVPYSDCGVFGC